MSYPHLEWQARWIEALKNAARKSKVEELGGEDLLENPVRVRLHAHRHIHTHTRMHTNSRPFAPTLFLSFFLSASSLKIVRLLFDHWSPLVLRELQ